jgi:membrane protein YqaA with SNARE-associated domain
MEALIQILESYGYLGMTIAAFLAGSVFPFSSEAVMASL